MIPSNFDQYDITVPNWSKKNHLKLILKIHEADYLRLKGIKR